MVGAHGRNRLCALLTVLTLNKEGKKSYKDTFNVVSRSNLKQIKKILFLELFYDKVIY